MVEKKDDDEHDKTEAENGENVDDKSHTDKHQHGEEYIKPGNKDYLSYYVYQGEWRPTKPKREVAATNKGPGPAIVNLPTAIGDQDHDPRRIRAPAYKIGERKLVIKLVGRNKVKFHKPATPRFTFGIRHSPYKAFQAFAPGD
ncbi:Outer dense fiber protein 3B like protein [Argiope bruennichi]|uniref:Outer dense fiber protein 3B like protein n=1 Tax=Argiope bruennichi TaxID=94029 RepID=A0A8T0FP45_ARGBR|nr:Outer dense fiber protein 3B like protein [Argiope bruennichi]